MSASQTAARLSALLLCTFLCCGCPGDDEIRVYRVARVPGAEDPAPHDHSSHAGHDHASQAGGGQADRGSPLGWSLPAGWTAAADDGQRKMREATLLPAGERGLEVGITVLGGDGGGLLENVNRWRAQVGQEPVEIPMQSLSPLQARSSRAYLADLTGPDGKRLLAAVLPFGQVSVYVKLYDSAEGGSTIAAERIDARLVAEFKQFVQSVGIGAPGAGAPAEAQAPAGPAGPLPSASAEPPTEQLGFRSSPPAEWTRAASRSMVLATWRAAGGQAEVAVSRFPGDVGGLLANLNRWRGQVGLEPAQAADSSTGVFPLETPAGNLIRLDGASQSMRVGMIPQAGMTWFFKLVGPPQQVDAEQERFLAWLGTISFVEESR